MTATPEVFDRLRVDADPVATEATLGIAADIDQAAAEDPRTPVRGTVLPARLPGTAPVRRGRPRRVRGPAVDPALLRPAHRAGHRPAVAAPGRSDRMTGRTP